MKIIYNLTQHTATVEQKAQGVVDLEGSLKERLLEALNFNSLPTASEVIMANMALGNIMAELDLDMSGDIGFMVGGAPYLMTALTRWAPCYRMVFAYTERVSKEVHNPDGTVTKTNVFKHTGFVPMHCPAI